MPSAVNVPRKKELVFVKSSADDTKVTIPGVERPWLSKAEGFILLNHDTGRILPAESQRNTNDPSVAVTDSLVTDYDSADKSSIRSTPLPPLKKLDGAEPISEPKTIKSILRSKSIFKAEALKGVIINEPSPALAKGNKSSSASKVHSAPAGKLKSVKIKDDPPLDIVIKELNDLKLQISKNHSSHSRNNQSQQTMGYLSYKLNIKQMDNPNITMEEYIRLEEEKARKRGKVFNWETAKYVKIAIRHMALPPRDQRHQYLRYKGLKYTNADILDFQSRLTRIYRREVHRVQVFDFGGLPDLMAEGLRGRMLMKHRFPWHNPSYTEIRDPILRLCHSLIAYSIVRRSQAPEKVTVTDLFYLKGMDVGSVNVPYLLARYLRLFAVGRKIRALIYGGQFVARLAEHFRLWTEERLRGLTVIAPKLLIIDMAELVRLQICMEVDDTWAWAVPAPVQAPPPPPAATRTMPQRMARLEEDVHEIRGALAEQREVIGAMARDFLRFTVWAISRIAQLLDSARNKTDRPHERDIDEHWINVSRKPIWYLDRGCLRHMTGIKSYLHKYVEQSGPKLVFGDDSTCTTEGYGSIKCNGIVFTKVAFVNGLKYNLISISQLCDAKYIVQLDEKRGTIFNSNKEVVMIAPRDKPCSSCEKGKHHRASFKTKQTSSIKKCLHLLHMDLFGPVTPRSINHEKYTLVIVDEYSRYTWVYFLKKKSQAPETIMSFIKRVENQNDIKVKQLRTDNGTEFRNSILVNFCDEKADDGYLLGYSLVSKAFKVFNARRQKTKETYHITFDESSDAIKFSKPLVDNIKIAKTERSPPDEYIHPYEPSQRYQTNSSDVSFIEPYEYPEPVFLETKVSFDQNGQTDQNDHNDQNDQSIQNDEILNDDHSEHSNHTNNEQIIDNLPNTKDI
ncbi:retrovirus-related pol polyprotein from transposon TNT 1-94 [Tanacetum coccineum]